jgi:hypothetical protein
VGLAVGLTAGATAPPSTGVTMPHPAPNVRAATADADATETACERCHAAIAAEWRSSMHHASFTDEVFQRSFTQEPDPFCKGCHAPEADAALGVGCITCHVTGGGVLAAPRATGTTGATGGERAERAPHAVTRSAEFAGVPACARCHEFAFPDAHLRTTPLAMQRTVTEHAGRDGTCASCHMPRRAGHADHRFAASRDVAFVRSAVTVRARRTSASAIEVTLAPAAVGHAFPTGDLFRRVRVTAGTETRFLARHYANRQERPGVVVKAEVSDDRVLGVARVVTLPAPAQPTRVRVVYERAEGPSDVAASRATVAGAIDLFDGEL